MTRKISKTIGLIGFSLSAFFYGCTKEDNVAAGLTGDISNAYRVDTFEISSKIILDNDSIKSFDATQVLLGQYTDEIFGEVKGEAYFSLANTSSSYEVPSGAVVDSVVIKLHQNSARTYGLLSVAHNYELYRLSEMMDRTSTVLTNNTSYSAEPTNLVESASFMPAPAQDSIVTLALSNSFGAELLAYSYDSLIDYHNGFLLKGALENTSLQGIYTASSYTGLTVYYHTSSETGLSAGYLLNHNLGTINGDRTGTSFQSLVNSGDVVKSDDFNNQIAVQAGTGVRTIVGFPHLGEFIKSIEGQIINLAYLEIHVDTTKNTSVPVPDYVSAMQTLSNKSTGEDVEEVSLYSYYADAAGYNIYNTDEAVYRIPLTYLINSFLSGENTPDVYSIVPAFDSYKVNSFIGFDANVLNGDNAMKLVIYHSESSID